MNSPLDETKLASSAETLVTRLIGADRKRKWQVRVLGVACILLIVVAVVSGLALKHTQDLASQVHTQVAANARTTQSLEQYVQTYAQHSCQALELLTYTPVTPPADPAANPSREATYKFYLALLFWEQADGCKTIQIPGK